MAKLRTADFYYGAILSLLFSNHIKPAIVEGGDDRQVYDFTTNSTEFRLFTKYRTDKNKTKKADYSSWTFGFTENDKNEITDYIDRKYKLVVALLCGSQKLSQSEIIFLSKDEIEKLLKIKSSISVSRLKGEHAFRVSIGGGRSNSLQIKANRFEELFLTDK